MPKRIVFAGGGYIANEFAGIFHEFGSKVTVVNRSDVILRGYEEALRDRLLQISITKGIDFKFNAAFPTVERAEDGTLTVYLTGCDPIEADAILFALGRTPNTDGLGLETAGVEIAEKGAVVVDADNKIGRASGRDRGCQNV